MNEKAQLEKGTHIDTNKLPPIFRSFNFGLCLLIMDQKSFTAFRIHPTGKVQFLSCKNLTPAAKTSPRVCQNQLGISDASAVRQAYSLLLPVNADHCFTLKIANHRTT